MWVVGDARNGIVNRAVRRSSRQDERTYGIEIRDLTCTTAAPWTRLAAKDAAHRASGHLPTEVPIWPLVFRLLQTQKTTRHSPSSLLFASFQPPPWQTINSSPPIFLFLFPQTNHIHTIYIAHAVSSRLAKTCSFLLLRLFLRLDTRPSVPLFVSQILMSSYT